MQIYNTAKANMKQMYKRRGKMSKRMGLLSERRNSFLFLIKYLYVV